MSFPIGPRANGVLRAFEYVTNSVITPGTQDTINVTIVATSSNETTGIRCSVGFMVVPEHRNFINTGYAKVYFYPRTPIQKHNFPQMSPQMCASISSHPPPLTVGVVIPLASCQGMLSDVEPSTRYYFAPQSEGPLTFFLLGKGVSAYM